LVCGVLVSTGSYCSTHAPQKENTTARGYGAGWQRLSRRVIERDGGVCQIRGPRCTWWATTTDHVIAKANGGTDDPTNLQAACRPCNSGKRDRR
jgi:5-methylcytosine-specific restriction protein A